MEANNNFKAAKAYALEHTEVVIVHQKCPYTYVRAQCEWKGDYTHEMAFSKCRWPDKWDAEYGVELARKKAAADIARRMVRDGWEPEGQ